MQHEILTEQLLKKTLTIIMLLQTDQKSNFSNIAYHNIQHKRLM